jgi:hypothetical protein
MKTQLKVGAVSGLAVTMSGAESAVSNLRAEWIKLPAAEQGQQLAEFVQSAVAKGRLAMVIAMAYLATMPQRAEAEAVAEGYIKHAEAQMQKAMLPADAKKHANVGALEKAGMVKEKGADSEGRDTYRTIGEMRSRFGRVIRAVWGTKGTGANKLEGIGSDAVVAILTGPGTITEKLALLPSTRGPVAAPVSAVQRRIAAAAGTVVPSLDSWADVLGVKPEKGAEKVKPKVLDDVMLAAIKVLPDDRWMVTMQALVARGFAANIPGVVEVAQNIKSVLMASELSKPAAKRTSKAKASNKQEKVTQ